MSESERTEQEISRIIIGSVRSCGVHSFKSLKFLYKMQITIILKSKVVCVMFGCVHVRQ